MSFNLPIAPGEALNPQLHQVCEVRECSALEELDDVTFNMLKEGAVLETLRAGMRDSEGIVLRKALVAVCEKSETTESPPATGDLPDHVHSIDNLNVSVDDLDFYEDDHEGYDSEDDE